MRSNPLAASAFALVAGVALAAGLAGPSLAQPAARAPAAATAATAGGKTTILPGYWSYDYKIGVIPVSSENKCLKPADVEQFSRGICTRRYRCDYTTNVVSNGKIKLKGAWTDKKDRVSPVTAEGVYSPERFKMDIHIKTINGMPLAGSLSAKRVAAECPSEETASK